MTALDPYYESACAVVPRPAPVFGTAASFWRGEDPVVEPRAPNDPDNKVVKVGGMWSHQRQWWGLDNFVKILVGGYGSGKTLIGCKRAVALALQNAPCPVAIVSPTYILARQTVIATMQGLLSGKQTLYGPRQFWWKWKEQAHEFHIRFHGRAAKIIVYSGEDPLSLRGPNLAAAVIDEPFIQDEEVFKQMVARVRHPDAVLREIGLTGTPEQLNWGYDLCLGELNDRFDVGFIQASTRQNLALDAGYVKRLEGGYTGKATKAYVDGAFVNLAEGQVYYGFEGLKGVQIQDIPVPDLAELGCGMDFNVNPFAFTMFWRAGSHVHYFDEYELPNADTEFACQVLREHYVDKDDGSGRRRLPIQHVLHTIYPDATGNARKTSAPEAKSDFWYIRKAGFNIRAEHTNPKRRDRYNAVNGKFRPKVGPSTLSVSPKCKRLIKYLSTYSYELMKEQEAMSHLLDAFGYPIAHLFPVGGRTVGSFQLVGH